MILTIRRLGGKTAELSMVPDVHVLLGDWLLASCVSLCEALLHCATQYALVDKHSPVWNVTTDLWNSLLDVDVSAVAQYII